MIRHSHEVYKYHQKLVDSIRPQAPVGGILVKPINVVQKIGYIFIFSFFNHIHVFFIMVPPSVRAF